MKSIREEWDQFALVAVPVGLPNPLRALVRWAYFTAFKSGMLAVTHAIQDCDGDLDQAAVRISPLIEEQMPGAVDRSST